MTCHWPSKTLVEKRSCAEPLSVHAGAGSRSTAGFCGTWRPTAMRVPSASSGDCTERHKSIRKHWMFPTACFVSRHRSNRRSLRASVFSTWASVVLLYSLGVLHHTPDARQAFDRLIRYLKPGGTIVISVYDAHTWAPGSVLETSNRILRAVTTRLPSRLLYALCICELPIYAIRKIPGMDALLHLLLPGIIYHAIPTTNRHPRVREHILDTFDWLSPKYQSKHTYPL